MPVHKKKKKRTSVNGQSNSRNYSVENPHSHRVESLLSSPFSFLRYFHVVCLKLNLSEKFLCSYGLEIGFRHILQPAEMWWQEHRPSWASPKPPVAQTCMWVQIPQLKLGNGAMELAWQGGIIPPLQDLPFSAVLPEPQLEPFLPTNLTQTYHSCRTWCSHRCHNKSYRGWWEQQLFVFCGTYAFFACKKHPEYQHSGTFVRDAVMNLLNSWQSQGKDFFSHSFYLSIQDSGCLEKKLSLWYLCAQCLVQRSPGPSVESSIFFQLKHQPSAQQKEL